ncbi:serine/threonine-protein kinase [Desulfotomaculum sp. 1211_IL3151]|uniref:serine/threonine-protein kinase n=1 Tax=Desulfotomaculum sp. 1211_IL3151 TaxID=3084055 RepID=UPI002FD9170F
MAKNKNKLMAKLADGTRVAYLPEIIGEGSEGVVHFTADRKSVIKFYKDDDDLRDPERMERIINIVEKYNPTLDTRSGEYWKKLYCWPDGLVVSPKLGVRVPIYPKNFFTNDGTEKKLSWFVNPKSRKLIPQEERGTWLGHLQMAITMARSTRRLHSAGLAHSDLSYNNFLGDPVNGMTVMIDLDGLVVPGLHPPKIAGTPGLIAPEVIMGTAEPSIRTDLHALAVLIYQTLMFRHPLRGPKVNSTVSAEEDEKLSMGKNALFIEHPLNKSNRPKGLATGYECLGPYLSELITQSFVSSLHMPDNRPTAMDWETALVRTTDLIYPCGCEMKWFVLSKSTNYTCPFCKQKPRAPYVPSLHFYREQPGKPGNFLNEKHRLVVWHGLYLYKWHVFDNIWPGENVDKTPQGYFVYHNYEWYLYNIEMNLTIIDNGLHRNVAKGQYVKLIEGLQLRLSSDPRGRLLLTQFLKV